MFSDNISNIYSSGLQSESKDPQGSVVRLHGSAARRGIIYFHHNFIGNEHNYRIYDYFGTVFYTFSVIKLNAEILSGSELGP